MTQLPQLPDHWHVSFEGSDVIFDNHDDATKAFLDFCDNMFLDLGLDREDSEEKINFHSSLAPFMIYHMTMGSWSALCIPCAGCKKRSLN
jgi:hypothetical protein